MGLGIGYVRDNMYRENVTIKGHPLADKGGRVHKHRLVLWDKLLGRGAPCHWCYRALIWRRSRSGTDTLNADHLDGNQKNNSADNLVPACRGCNGNRVQYRALKQCVCCGATFWPRRPESKFCLKFCYFKHRLVCP